MEYIIPIVGIEAYGDYMLAQYASKGGKKAAKKGSKKAAKKSSKKAAKKSSKKSAKKGATRKLFSFLGF